MIIYNITFKADWSIQEQWLQWMLDVHVPGMMATGCFESYQAARLLEVDESEGPTFSFQFYAISKAQYNRYLTLYAPALRVDSRERWGEKLVSFRSLMESVH